ncbi:MAG: PKD domain-containing protein [Sphingobacteriales bacterium]
MKKAGICLIINLLFLNFFSYSQIVGVDKPTGGARVTIPLYTVSAGNVSLPIALSYGTSGIRATDIEGSAGIGWNLVAGGAVSRQVRGLPDDITTDNASVARTGWINSTNGNTINTMTIANTSNPPIYTNVATDVSFINSNFGNWSDTEPDIFNISAPGLSLQFVFDKDHIIRTIPYQDVKITYTTGTNGIISFTVTNDRGITYKFSAMESTTRKPWETNAAPSWFKTDYQQYYNGITYTSAWKLTQMQDQYGNCINLNYTAGTSIPNSSNVDVYLNGSTTATHQYKIWQKTTPKLLSSITYQDAFDDPQITAFTLAYSTNGYTNASYVNSMTGFGRTFQFNYTANVHSGDNFTRYFLTNVTDPDCNTPVNYSFSYNNLSALPDSTSTQLDYWGYTNGNLYAANLKPQITVNPSNASYDRYYNPVSDNGYNTSIYPYKINGYSRWIAPSYLTIGSLSQVNYATGGYTTIGYESNDYYDNTLSLTQQGGGIRVNQISNYDGINASPTSTSYTYTDPSTGQSSGKAISLPIYAFTQAYTSSEADSIKWRKSTVISWSDLSSDDHSIIYNYVKESRTGAGSTLYQFSTPVTQWDSSTPSGAPTWSPTTAYAGAPANISIGFLNNTTRMYPFPPSTNYDFERGLPLDVTAFDGSGNKVSETTYTYNTPQAPVTITAFKYDSNTSAEEGYGKYYIYTTAGPLTTQVVNKLYSAAAPASYRQTTSNYTYGGSMYKLSQESTTNSDGTVYNKYIKYVKDYTITSAGDGMTQALLNLQAANVNAPVEEYAQVTPPGGSVTTVSAGLVNSAVFTAAGGGSLTAPSKRSAISNPNGGTFTPSYVTGSPQAFVYDYNHYTTVENDLGYDYSGYLLSKDNGFKHVSTVLTDHYSYQPVATVDNARYDEIAFSDFDSNLPTINFTGTTTLTSTSRSGQYANSLAASATLSKTVNRNLLASNYIISAWIRCPGSTAGTISATITGGTQTNPGSTSYVASTATNASYPTGWQYVEFQVPLTSITSSTITINVSCNTAVIMDDLWAYPDIAEVSTVAHDPVAFFKTAATNTNGVASYFSYDKFGRLLFAFDQDKNIVQRKIYASATNETNLTAPTISGSSTAYNGISNNWSMTAPVYNSCIITAGVTYTWNFGDGTAPVTNATTSPVSHTYSANGTYTLTLTVSSPAYGSKASSLPVTVSTLPWTNVTYNNYTTGSSISTVVFKQGGTTKYTLTTAQLSAGYNITPGVYDITINPTGSLYNSGTGLGYGCISFTGGSDISYCFSYTGSSFTATAVNLTYEPTINFGMYTSPSCN